MTKTKKLRILILANEAWNDYIFANGVLTNWFTGFNAEFAEIYLSPALPHNNICNRYFRVTDKQMLKSFVGKKAGHTVKQDKTISKVTGMYTGIYTYLKKISLYIHTPMMMINDFIWYFGRYNVKSLKSFIDDFNPDIVFSPRYGCVKLFRIERIISSMTSAPIIAFTGDNEIGYDVYSLSPLYWLRRYYTTVMFRNNSKIYSHYFMHSQLQADLYKNKYGIPTSTLYKCINSSIINHISYVNEPIVMLYAGRLYCNRWRTLAEIGKALKIINKDRVRIRLDIYTSDNITSEQKSSLSEENYIFVHPPVTSDELNKIYGRADIALHVESFDKKYIYLTKYSFSTKIIDLLSSGCAVMAICWEKQTGYQYLKANNAAFCISNYNDILKCLQNIVKNPYLVKEYAVKAQKCAFTNHNRNKVQDLLYNTFTSYLK